jgi:phage shock protein A
MNITKMNVLEAKEEFLAFVATLKLTQKEISALEIEAEKWKNRTQLAEKHGQEDLIKESFKEAERINFKLSVLKEEEHSLKSSIDELRKLIPALTARERIIDPDLLEQELLAALGQTEEEARAERAFRKLEKENAVDLALEELKIKMKGGAP